MTRLWLGGECARGLLFSRHARVSKLIHTATPDTTRLPRLPVDRRRRDAGQAGSYA